MLKDLKLTLAFAALAVGVLAAQVPDARQIAQERASAELDAPKLAVELGLKPGMTVGDVGSGFGAMTVVLGKWIGSGHVFLTDITEHALRETRAYVKREGKRNINVIERGGRRDQSARGLLRCALPPERVSPRHGDPGVQQEPARVAQAGRLAGDHRCRA